MKRAKIFTAVLAVFALLMSMAVMGTVADTAAENSTTETWDSEYTITRNGSISHLDADFDVYRYSYADGAYSKYSGPHDPTATDSERTAAPKTYMTTSAYGTHSQGFLKFVNNSNAAYYAMTYAKEELKDFTMKFSMYAGSGNIGMMFGADAGVFPFSRDNNSSNDTGVLLFVEGSSGHVNVGGAIDTATIKLPEGVTSGTQADFSGVSNFRANITEGETAPVTKGAVLDTDNYYTVYVQVKDSVLTVWEQDHQDQAVSVTLINYDGGYVSLINDSVQSGSFKDFAFRNDEVFDDSIAIAYKSDVSLLDYDFDVYRFTQTGGVFSKYTGPNNPSDTDPARTSTPKTYMTTSTSYGSYSRGYLKFVNNADVAGCAGFYALSYEKKAPANFTASYSYYPGYNNLGMMIASAPGVFPVSEDKDNTNDTGIMIWTTAAGSVAIAGAFDATSLKTADGMGVSTHEDLCASGVSAVNHVYIAGTTGGESIAVAGTITEGDTNYFTYNVQIVDNVLTVWEKDHADLAVSVTLTDAYEGGCISFINDDVQSGAFRDFKFVTGATYVAPVVMDETTGVITVNGVTGKELKAGSLIVTDANGEQYIPQRVGFREGGNAEKYQVVDEGFDPTGATVQYQFLQPTLENPNIGNLGASYNGTLTGLRFISRFTRTVTDSTQSLVTAAGTKYEITDYGMLLSSAPGLATTAATEEEDMVVGSANRYVQQLSIKAADKYYDVCADHVDMAVTIINIDQLKDMGYEAPEALDFYARPYVVVKLSDAETQVLYGDVFSCAYEDVYKAAA